MQFQRKREISSIKSVEIIFMGGVMKSVIFAGTVFTFLCLFHGGIARADEIPPGGRLVDVHSQSLFIPVGFDDNDETVIVLDGFLPDTCFKVAPAIVTRDLEHKRIIVEQQAREFSGVCLDMIVPFTTVIKLGVYPQGDFTVVTNHGEMTESLPVKRASTTSSDDHLYAPIDTVQVEEREDGNFVAILNGRFTNTCMNIDNVIVTNHEKTIEMMPILRVKPLADNPHCGMLVFDFQKEVPLPSVGTGSHLLHVRSLDGQSVNVVFRGRSISNNR